MLENYQIKVSKYIDASYVKTFFDNNLEVSEMTHKIVHGYNENEVSLIQKIKKNQHFLKNSFNFSVSVVFSRNISCFLILHKSN